MRFRDRKDAGQSLADLLTHYRGRPDVLVLGLPRGGVPVARTVAEALSVPMDIFLVRKLGVPGHEELAMDAVAEGDVVILNKDIVRQIPPEEVDRVIHRETRKLRSRDYRDGQPRQEITGRTVILVDDGLTTGASMRSAIEALRRLEPEKIVVAVPVAPAQTCRELRTLVDEVICATTPEPFGAVGRAYRNFDQVTDQEVRELLKR
jgi:predicted phosphoribosyltransferase